MSTAFRMGLFRQRDGEGGSRVTNIELFFDLVFVFAITQLSHRLLTHFSLAGALETFVLFLAVWWLWVYTSWVTNWLDPEKPAVRALLIAMMFGGLVMSTAIPNAFATKGMVFAAAYVALQLLRTLYVLWAAWGHHPARARNFTRIAFYFVLSAPLWIYGAQAEWPVRITCWAIAIAIEYAGPFTFFATPGLGRSGPSDWDISGAHMAERCALFIIIALGEALLVTGATYAGAPPAPGVDLAFVMCVVGSAAMWWIYFDSGAVRGGEAIEHSDNAGILARNGYTYLHMPIVAGIVVGAVADEMMLAHPVGHSDLAYVLVACGGPALFLLGNQAFKWLTADYAMPPLSHFIGLALLTGVGVQGLRAHWTPLDIGMGATGALVATAIWEWFAVHGGWRRWAPWLGRPTVIALEESER